MAGKLKKGQTRLVDARGPIKGKAGVAKAAGEKRLRAGGKVRPGGGGRGGGGGGGGK